MKYNNIYIYIEREREKERYTYIYIIFLFCFFLSSLGRSRSAKEAVIIHGTFPCTFRKLLKHLHCMLCGACLSSFCLQPDACHPSAVPVCLLLHHWTGHSCTVGLAAEGASECKRRTGSTKTCPQFCKASGQPSRPYLAPLLQWWPAFFLARSSLGGLQPQSRHEPASSSTSTLPKPRQSQGATV